ncbi:unnamed protein product [Schistosoma curassoni]|uniref:(d)CMP kinase n=1 Tax=Schistosoma curassoni TaxID=6186 RepID=A0A183KII5_9TREM|nr:unnamed protein product [Schistosoma curassoni]
MTQRRNWWDIIIINIIIIPVKGKEGNPITEIEEQRKRWVEQLNKQAPLNSSDIEAVPTDILMDVTQATIEEIWTVIRLIKGEEAAGPDKIKLEALVCA